MRGRSMLDVGVENEDEDSMNEISAEVRAELQAQHSENQISFAEQQESSRRGNSV